MAQLVFDPSKVYVITRRVVTLEDWARDNFKNVCMIMKTSTNVVHLRVNFWLDAASLDSLGNALSENRSIRTVQLFIDRPMDTEALRRFGAVIAENKYLNLDFNIQPGCSNMQVIESMKGVHVASKGYKVSFISCREELLTQEFFEKQIELLQTTNVNKIAWECRGQGSLVVSYNLTGFSTFLAYLIKQDPLKEFSTWTVIDDNSLPYLVNYIRSSRNLRGLTLSLAGSRLPSKVGDLYDSLEKSGLKHLTFIKQPFIDAGYAEFDLSRTARSMARLTYLSIRFGQVNASFIKDVLTASKSVRRIDTSLFWSDSSLEAQFAALFLQNRQQQNTHVADLITVLWNIARNTSSPITRIPRDIWPLILSYISFPGVSLNFGDIAWSIFKDIAIRRVIYKPVKRQALGVMCSAVCGLRVIDEVKLVFSASSNLKFPFSNASYIINRML